MTDGIYSADALLSARITGWIVGDATLVGFPSMTIPVFIVCRRGHSRAPWCIMGPDGAFYAKRVVWPHMGPMPKMAWFKTPGAAKRWLRRITGGTT